MTSPSFAPEAGAVTLHPPPTAAKVPPKPSPTDAITIAVIREDLDQLCAEVEDLVCIPKSADIANTSFRSMNLADLRTAVATLGGDAVSSASSSSSSFSSTRDPIPPTQSSDASITPNHIATSPSPPELKETHTVCPHCIPLHKLDALALHTLALVHSKAQLASTLRTLQRRLRSKERELRRTKRERDDAVADGDGARGMLGEAWWEIAVLRANANAKATADEESNGKGEGEGDGGMHESIAAARGSSGADSDAGFATRRLRLRLQVYRDRDRDHETHRSVPASPSHSYRAPDPPEVDVPRLLALLHHLRAENARLVNVEADCQALIEGRQVLSFQDNEDDEQGIRHGDAWPLHRVHELERRNAYLEHRLRLHEEERARMSTLTSLRGDSDVVLEAEERVRGPRVRFGGRGWNLNLSLRGQRRKGDVEEGV